MDERIRKAIAEHEDFQRLRKVFPLEFVLNALDNPRRGANPKFIAKLLREYAGNPSLFIAGIHYHELVELEEKTKRGYTSERLKESNSQDLNYRLHCTISKRKEIEFYRTAGNLVLNFNLPSLAVLFATAAPWGDYGATIPPYEDCYQGIQYGMRHGIPEWCLSTSIKMVKKAIYLFELGGDKCSGRQTTLDYAQKYLSGVVGRKPSILDSF